jgi:anti-anti-sigma factor
MCDKARSFQNHPPGRTVEPVFWYSLAVPNDWNEDILLAELSEEPQLSEELTSAIERVEGDAAAGARAKHVVLNFAGVRYISSSHLAQLIRLRKLLAESKRQLVICSINDHIWSVFLMSGLDRVFRFMPDALTALATLQLEAEPDHGERR